jgi:MFS family permease
MWATVGFGTAMVSRTWGRIIDRHGPRPVLRLCVFFKPLVALAFVLVTPRVAFPVLGVVFYFDAMLNSGYNISLNGFMLKSAPRENRSMFVAAVTAVSGIAGGLSAIASGWLLHRLEGFSPVWLGRTWNNYHVIFLISFLLRIACIPLTARVRERDSSPTVTVFNYLMGLWPMRVILFPVGLYRRATAGEDEPGAPEEESTARRSGEGP